AAIRIERPEVFKATHDFILDLAASGKITGLRIDHPDGLWDPAAYFLQLQETYVRKSLEQQSQNDGVEQIDHAFRHWLAAEQRHPGQTPWPLYTVAEKILSENEPLPQDWAV